MNARRMLGVAASIVLGVVLAFGGPALEAVSNGSPPVMIGCVCGAVADHSPPVAEDSPPVADDSPAQDMVSVSVPEPAFSPNGDGCLDVAQIHVTFRWPDDSDFASWNVWVEDDTGRFVTGLGSGGDRPAHRTLTWHGRGSAHDGTYTVRANASVFDWENHHFGEDSATVVLDTRPPALTTTFPDARRIGSSSVGVDATYSTDDQVRAHYDEPLRVRDSDLDVLARTGIPVSGRTSYDPAARALVFRAGSPMGGEYEAIATATDRACNQATDRWSFVAVAP